MLKNLLDIAIALTSGIDNSDAFNFDVMLSQYEITKAT